MWSMAACKFSVRAARVHSVSLHVSASHEASRPGIAARGAKAWLAEPLQIAQTSPSRLAPLFVHVGWPSATPTHRPPRRLAEQLRTARGAADALAAEAEAQERLARFHAHLSAGAPPG